MPLDRQPYLTGELLSLRPMVERDFEALFAVAGDPLVWEQHPARDRWQEPVFRKLFLEGLASGGALVALKAGTDEIIGTSRYHDYNEELSQVEIGWTFLARAHWGGAYNGEMKRLMLRHAFQYVESVLFLVDPDNTRSQRAMEKVGGIRDGMRDNAYGMPSIVFRIRSADFEA